jgi:hypothetical protein
MNVGFNTVQQNRCLKSNANQPSFQAKFESTPEALNHLKKDVEWGYKNWKDIDHNIKKCCFKNKPFNFEKIYENFKNAFEKTTEGVDGNLKLILRHEEKNYTTPELIYEKAGKTYHVPEVPHGGFFIMPDTRVDHRKPCSHTVKKLIAKIEYALRKDGETTTESNTFSSLCDKLNIKKY